MTEVELVCVTTMPHGVWANQGRSRYSTRRWVMSFYLESISIGRGILNVELAGRASRSLPREQGMGVGPGENGGLIRPTKASPCGTYFVPSRLCLRGLRPEKAVLSARPDAFRAASGLKRVDPRFHVSTFQHSLTLAISQCARINPR